MEPDVPSPCRKVCKMLESRNHAFCEGCGRSLNEIARWTQMENKERLFTLRRANARLAERGKPMEISDDKSAKEVSLGDS